MSELETKLARALWERHHPNGRWEARMSWYNATPDEKARELARGTHPDNFDYNLDIEDAFADARLAIQFLAGKTS